MRLRKFRRPRQRGADFSKTDSAAAEAKNRARKSWKARIRNDDALPVLLLQGFGDVNGVKPGTNPSAFANDSESKSNYAEDRVLSGMADNWRQAFPTNAAKS